MLIARRLLLRGRPFTKIKLLSLLPQRNYTFYDKRPLQYWKIGHEQRRNFNTGTGFVPRGLFFKLFWTGTTATFGYVYYQVNQASNWMHEKFGLLHDVGLEALFGAIQTWDNVASKADEVSGWNPFNWQKKSKNHSKEIDSNSNSNPSSSAGPDDNTGINIGIDVDHGNYDQFRDFIKRMIEVRNILKTADMDSSLRLPSIVVIGSQSSGKSSVLESIVGHEFLPKGSNMVTRRPLELTLVNSPSCGRDYALFNHLETGPIYDFAQVQKTLTDLNLAVPEKQWISNKPIELTIYSRNVPDLSLVDLPGYIQVNNRKQPPILREKIAQLCESYIRQDNIILAVCAADVDLANAEALKASRIVDPQGWRTIGVITKLDLVDAAYSAHLINNEDYPLKLGYIGVVCKPTDAAPQPRSLSILSRRNGDSSLTGARYEDYFFSEHGDVFSPLKGNIGIGSLREKLTKSLENSMAQSLSALVQGVESELGEVRYQLKVEYSDRSMTPEGYVSFLAASVKNGLENVARNYSRPQVREQLRKVMQDRLLSVASECFWSDSNGEVKNNIFDEQRLKQAVAMLTRSGIGRLAANSLVDAIISQVKQVIKDGPLVHHPAAKERLLQQVENAMRTRCQVTIDQVENAIKPLKNELEYTDEDWKEARSKTMSLLKNRLNQSLDTLRQLQTSVGQKRLRRIIQHLSEVEHSSQISFDSDNTSFMNPALVEKAKEAVHLNRRINVLKQRLAYMESGECLVPKMNSSDEGWFSWAFGNGGTQGVSGNQYITTPSDSKTVHLWNECQLNCPEVYLYLVMEKLLATSALHVHNELVQEFLHPFPDDLAATKVMGLERKEILLFVQENPSVARHLHLLERRRILESVKDRLAYLRSFKEHHVQ